MHAVHEDMHVLMSAVAVRHDQRLMLSELQGREHPVRDALLCLA
jgi:hypothetical protein